MNKGLKQIVIAALKKCQDPELGIDIYQLGLIYRIEVDPQQVIITMTLTTPGCPLAGYFKQTVIEQVSRDTKIKDVQVNLTFEPPWSPDKINPAVRKNLTIFK